jgi:hypothetical protein
MWRSATERYSGIRAIFSFHQSIQFSFNVMTGKDQTHETELRNQARNAFGDCDPSGNGTSKQLFNPQRFDRGTMSVMAVRIADEEHEEEPAASR